jgi:hypothetical protein
MSSRLKPLTEAYIQLSSLYKNPTRHLRGMAASAQDAELVGRHAELLALFKAVEWGRRAKKSPLYFKVLALLYEVDDYRGMTPSVEPLILKESTASLGHFDARSGADRPGDSRETDFSDPDVRALWKAKVLCCVAAVESKRKSSDADALLHDLNILEAFVHEKLHRPGEALPAWTTLALVRHAQARVARQGEDYTYVRDKLLSVVECLDARAAELIEKLSALVEKSSARRRGKDTRRVEDAIREPGDELAGLEDDLVFIRQKQTLAILFSVGLDNLQRGFLDSANHACQAARFQFRLHGHTYHRLFNELLMVSIKRARTSTKNKDDFLPLEAELERKILPHLEPKGAAGNPKLYVYGLRELAVVQHACGKSAEMRATLRKMEKVKPLGPQWKSRISILHSRALYGGWRHSSAEITGEDRGPLLDALNHSEIAFNHATGGKEGIASHRDAPRLLSFIKGSGSRNLIDTMEGLLTYGTVQLFFKKYFDAVGKPVKSAGAVKEAMKSAEAVIELSGADNPRLLAMGHLVLADAYRESDLIVEARQHLEFAKTLEARIEHRYVKDRRKAIEKKIQTTLTLYHKDCGHINQAVDKVFGWYIGNCKDKSSTNKIAAQLGIGSQRLEAYIERQGPSSPYYDLLPRLRENKKKRRK